MRVSARLNRPPVRAEALPALLKVMVAMVEIPFGRVVSLLLRSRQLSRVVLSGKSPKSMSDMRFLHVRNKPVAMHKIAAGSARAEVRLP